MKNTMKHAISSLSFFALFVCAALFSCSKDVTDIRSKSAANSEDIEQCEGQHTSSGTVDMLVYCNDVLGGDINALNKDSLVGIILGDKIHYFDNERLFEAFCLAHQLDNVYETNLKLDLIGQKALELGIAEDDCLSVDDVPVEMKNYWQTIFGTPMDMPMEKIAWRVKAYDKANYSGGSKNCVGPTYWSLGSFNNKTSSFEVYPSNAGGITWCHRRWYRKPRIFYAYVLPAVPLRVPYLPSNHDNNFCSYFTI